MEELRGNNVENKTSKVNAKQASGKIQDTISETKKEYLAVIDGDGNLTGETCERGQAHKEGIPHYSVHIWVVNTQRFKDDIGIYVCHKASKHDNKYLQFRTAGGHVAVDQDWAMQGNESQVRKELLKSEAIKEVGEELGLNISPEDGLVTRSSNGEVLKQDANFRVIKDSMPYQSIRRKVKDGNVRTEINNEHIGVFAFEFDGDITDVDPGEIEKIELIPSKELQKLLENSPETFGHRDDSDWKETCKYKAAIKILTDIQEQYNISH